MDISVEKITQFDNENGKAIMAVVIIYPDDFPGDAITVEIKLPHNPQSTLAEVERDAKEVALHKLRKAAKHLESM